TGLYATDLKGKVETLYKKDNHVFGFTYNKNNDHFILGISTPTNPGDFYLFKGEEKLKRLTNTNKTLLQDDSLAEPEELTFKASDDGESQGWLLIPYGVEEGKKYPFVLQIHGGPHMMYGQSFSHEMQLLAAKGYVVLYTNPRGS